MHQKDNNLYGAFFIFLIFIINKKTEPNGTVFGASRGIRTPDLWFRRPTLYPAEL